MVHAAKTSPSATSHGLNSPSPCLSARLKPTTEPRDPEQSTNSLPKARDERRNHRLHSLIASLAHLNPSFLPLSSKQEKVETAATLVGCFFPPPLPVLKLQAERAVH